MLRGLLICMWLSLLLAGCSKPLPRVIVLNDALDARGHNDLGVAYEASDEHDLALREYKRAAELDTSWERPLINQGNVLAAEGDWKQAAQCYRAALRRAPENGEAMNNLAWVLYRQGEVEQARVWIDKALAISPENPAFQDTLAEIREDREQGSGVD